MEININNKTYLGKYDENGELIIPLSSKEDVLFFQQWENERYNGVILKKDHVKDFDFINGYKEGVLYNCQSILNINLDYVKLVYDYNSWHLVLPCS